MGDTDQSIARGLLDNDPQALGQVSRWIAIALTSPRFWRLRGEWFDLHQETLARVIESIRLGRYDPARPFRAYVQGVARHTALQALSRMTHASDVPAPRDWPDLGSTDPESRVTRRQIVRRVLDTASQDCRKLIRAYYYDDLSYSEIANTLDIPVGTVKSRLFRCLEAAYLSLQGVARRGNRDAPARKKQRTEDPV